MRVRLLVQPYAASRGLLDSLTGALSDTRLTNFKGVVAWANYRGLDRLRTQLTDFRARGGASHLIVGIDEGGATVQGLKLALDLFDQVHVFFSADERTFHPKMYLVHGAQRARLVVGSNNLTPGGVFFNYEAALEVDLENTDEPGDDQEVIRAVNAYLETLYDDEAVCKPLPEVLDDLLSVPRYGIRDERRPRRRTKPEAGEEAPEPEETARIFGRSSETMRPTPAGSAVPPDDRPGAEAEEGEAGAIPTAAPTAAPEPGAPGPGAAPAPAAPTPTVEKRWFRRLDATQAQHPPGGAGSNVTGNLKLSQAGHAAIDHKSYFRNDFFSTVPWVPAPTARGPHETAVVPMRVTVDGTDTGVMDIELSHADYRIAGQNNVPTWLHWGRDQLMPVLRGTDYTGKYVTVERLSDGSYRLVIADAPTGPLMV